MKDNNQNNDLSKSELFYGSIYNIQVSNSINNKNRLSISNINPILKEEEYHYLCPKCYKFPLIEFTKSIKYVKFTCSCYNNKKISIKDLFDETKDYITINNLSSSNLLSSNIIKYNNNNEEGFKCKEHNDNFESFCETCLINICDECNYNHIFFPHKLIELESIKINNKKLNRIITIINSNKLSIFFFQLI